MGKSSQEQIGRLGPRQPVSKGTGTEGGRSTEELRYLACKPNHIFQLCAGDQRTQVEGGDTVGVG